ALAEHMEARAAWGAAVESGLGRVREHLRRCTPAGTNGCSAATLPGRAAVARRIDTLLAHSKALGGELCRASPELQSALGNERCTDIASHYALSFAQRLGKPDLLGQ